MCTPWRNDVKEKRVIERVREKNINTSSIQHYLQFKIQCNPIQFLVYFVDPYMFKFIIVAVSLFFFYSSLPSYKCRHFLFRLVLFNHKNEYILFFSFQRFHPLVCITIIKIICTVRCRRVSMRMYLYASMRTQCYVCF